MCSTSRQCAPTPTELSTDRTSVVAHTNHNHTCRHERQALSPNNKEVAAVIPMHRTMTALVCSENRFKMLINAAGLPRRLPRLPAGST